MSPAPSILAVLLFMVSHVGGCFTPHEGPFVGETAPDFSVVDTDGGPFTLSSERGRVVVFDLMGANCPPCRVSMIELNAAFEALAGEDVTFISVDMGVTYPGLGAQNETELVRFAVEENGTWPFALDPDGAVGAAYEPIALPTLLVIGTDGVVLARHDGGTVAAAEIEGTVRAALP